MIPQPNGVQKGNTGTKQPRIISNKINTLFELKLTIVNNGVGVITNLALIPGPVPSLMASKFGVTQPDGTNLILTSTLSTTANAYADLKAYLSAVGFHIAYMRFQATDTSVYNGSLFIGEMPPNGIASPEEIPLAQYASVVGGGGGYDKTLTISDHPFANTRNFFCYLSSVPINSTTTIAMGVDFIGNTITAQESY